MKKICFFIFTMIAAVLVSCKSTDVEEKPPVVQEPEVSYDDNSAEDEVEDVFEEVAAPVDNEYLRSINSIESGDMITQDEFNQDKAAILKIISELSDTMENFNFEKWKSYIDPNSIEYYSNFANLRKVQKKLRDKTIQLKGLKDYFRYVFIPSRKVSKVDEIRYVSRTSIKAVEVKPDEDEGDSLIVYYNFVKIDGNWMVSLPEIN